MVGRLPTTMLDGADGKENGAGPRSPLPIASHPSNRAFVGFVCGCTYVNI